MTGVGDGSACIPVRTVAASTAGCVDALTSGKPLTTLDTVLRALPARFYCVRRTPGISPIHMVSLSRSTYTGSVRGSQSTGTT